MRANSSLVRTAKDGSTGLAGSGVGLSPWRRQGGAAWSTSTSTSLRADGTVRTHTVKAFGGRLGGGGVASREQSDWVFPHPTTGASISLRSVVEGLRDAGLDVGDEDAVDALLEGLGRFAPQQVEDGSRGRSSDADLRCGWLGVDRARFPWHAGVRGFDTDPFVGGAAYPEQQVGEQAVGDGAGYGYGDDVLADIAELRGSYFREGLSLDLTWNHLFLDEEIPVPATILEWMRADRYARLHRFWRMVLVAAMTRTKLCPTVFLRGGGEGLNPDTHSDADPVIDPATGAGITDDTILYGQVKEGRTAHHASAVIPSALGWARWYWAEAEIGIDAPSSSWVSSDHGRLTLANQRFALNVYNGDEADPTTPASATTYLGRVALRKSLALAAFGRALGEGLGILDSVLTGLGYRLDHVIPHLEFGAEMDAQWAFTGVTSTSAADYPSEPLFAESAREYARFHAVLAATIRVGWPGARFKTTELASAANDTQWELRTVWLGDALAVQLDREAQFLDNVATVYRFARDTPEFDLSALGGSYPAAVDWYNEAVAAGLDLPPTDGRVTPSVLVQVTGIHYFRYWGTNADTPLGYLNESEMNDSILTPLLTYVLAPCRTAGIPLQWGAGNVGFPSADTFPDSGGHVLPSVYPGGNSQELQAGHLVRLLLTLIGYGASHVLWYAHMEAKETLGTSAAAGIFATMGLRNDVPDVEASVVASAASDAWPKAGWWAYQRLATLLARADRVEIVYNAAGCVVVRIVGGRNGLVSPNGSRTWRYGYVAWLDGASPRAAQTATIELDRLPEPDVVNWFERVALVPEATSPGAPGSPYADSTTPDWDDADPWNPDHFAHCSLPFVNLGEHTVFDASWHPQTVGRVGITLSPTTQANFGIVCWLTDSAALTVTRVA